MTKKDCPVCTLLNSDPDFSNYINSLLKGDTKIAEIILEFTHRNSLAPTEHYLKKHKNNCLKDFKVELSQPVLPLNNKENFKNEAIDVNSLNMVEELEKYRNMSFEQKEYEHFKRLKEIKYMSSIIIYHQLLYGRNSHKAIIPKEDISALKQIEDILQLSKLEEKFGKQNEQLSKLSDEQIKIIAGWIRETDEILLSK